MCLKLDTASFCPAQVAIAVRMCTWTLSGWKQHPFAITLYLLTAFEGHRELHLQLEPQLRNAERTGKMERWEDTSHPPEDHRGESPVELACDFAFSQWILTKPYRILGESWDLNNTFSAPPAAAKAWCFLLWMFGSNQSLPDTLSLQLLTCLYLPPQAATSHSLLPQLPFYPQSPIPPTASSRDDEVCEIIFFIYSLKRFTITYFFFFCPHSFNCFLRVMPSPIDPPDTAPNPRSDPPAQDRSWERPALNIVVCWEQHGVMWMRPGEAQSGSQGFMPWTLVRCLSKCTTVQCF